MKKIILSCLLSLFLGSVNAHVIMECIGEYQDPQSGETLQYFLGSGYKFIGHKKTLKNCHNWAQKNNLDPKNCKVTECYPQTDFDQMF